MQKVVTVMNIGRSDIVRANMLFRVSRKVSFVFDVDSPRFKEIKACSNLQVLAIEDREDTDYATKVTSESAVIAPDIAQKLADGDVIDITPEDLVTEEEASEAGKDLAAHAKQMHVKEAPEKVEPESVVEEPKPEPVIDETPVVVTPEVPIDAGELEVAEDIEPKKQTVISCPYCDFEAAAQVGAYHHVRTKHPDQYEEYKVRVRKS